MKAPKPLVIDGRTLSLASSVFVIAELGVNHDGSPARALKLVDIAHRCGADAVKLQVFSADRLMHQSSQFAAYQRKHVAADDPAAMLRGLELRPVELAAIVARIRELGMSPLATPFSPEDVAVIKSLGLPAVKIASPDLVNRPLLERVAQLKKPVLVSTGAATLDEVTQCAGWLADLAVPMAFLHCVSSYPTPPEQAHLGWIAEIGRRTNAPVGYSDHTTEVLTGALAVAAGAVVVEKHLTYDRAASGPDHAASADPTQFAQYVELIRRAQVLRGAPGKRVLPAEEDVRRVSRQSVVTLRPLRAGEKIRLEDLTVQRPGVGIPAALLSSIAGRRVRQALEAGTLLHWDMLDAA